MATAGSSDTPGDSDPDHLLQYRISEDEPASQALAVAFDRAGLREDSSVLYDWIEPEALDQLFDHHAGDPEVHATVWGHEISITRDRVTVYAD